MESSGDRLLVSEIFGPTLQGEGPSAGRSASFVRLSRCNLSCSWCDTPYSWDHRRFDLRRESTELSVDDIVARVAQLTPDLVVLTGGEPAIQVRSATKLVDALNGIGKSVELETNGTLQLGPLTALCRLIAVSPKLANSGLPQSTRIRYSILERLADLDNVVFKFVVRDHPDLDEVQELVTRLGIRADSIWIMPEGTEKRVVAERMRSLADAVAARGWALSGRLQLLLWDGRRGR